MLNVNALDASEMFDYDSMDNQVKRFTVPVIKLRQDNTLKLFITKDKRNTSPILKLRRFEVLLEQNEV